MPLAIFLGNLENKMIVEKRILNAKGHTKAYIIDGKRFTKWQTAQLARRGKLEGVAARHSKLYGWFIAAKPSADRRMFDLLTVKEPKGLKRSKK